MYKFNNNHVKDIQDFKDGFIKKVLQLAHVLQPPKAILSWELGHDAIEVENCREKNLQFVRKIMIEGQGHINKGLTSRCHHITETNLLML